MSRFRSARSAQSRTPAYSYVGNDIVIDRTDGSQVIYRGREGRADAIRDGVLRVR